MRKNFTAIPNAHFINENEETSLLSQLDYRQDYVFMKLKACQDKWGKGYQKSIADMAKICKMSDSTFKRIVKDLCNIGLVTKLALKKAGTKENEALIWTINHEWAFEELSTTLVQNELTSSQNDIGVGSNWTGGGVNLTEKKDVLKDLKDLSNSNIYNARQLEFINHYLNISEMAYMKDFLMNKGFSRGIIEDISQKVAIKLMEKAFKHFALKQDVILNNAISKYTSDVNNPNANFFVYKLEKEIELYNMKKIENDEKIRQYEEAIE